MASITVDLDGASAGFALANDTTELAEFFSALVEEFDMEEDNKFNSLVYHLKQEDSETRSRLYLMLNGIVEALKP